MGDLLTLCLVTWRLEQQGRNPWIMNRLLTCVLLCCCLAERCWDQEVIWSASCGKAESSRSWRVRWEVCLRRSKWLSQLLAGQTLPRYFLWGETFWNWRNEDIIFIVSIYIISWHLSEHDSYCHRQPASCAHQNSHHVYVIRGWLLIQRDHPQSILKLKKVPHNLTWCSGRWSSSS